MLKKHGFLLVCALLLTVILAACGTTPPADNNAASASDTQTSLRAQALSAYSEVLKSAPALEGEHEELADASFNYEQNLKKFGNHYDSFAVSDINQDGVPELIAITTVNFRWTPVSVYTFADGKAVLLKNPADALSPVTFEQNSSANGAYSLYLCADGHIHTTWKGNTPEGDKTEDNAYALEGTTLISKDCIAGENENTVYFSNISKANTAENREAITK